MCLVSCLRLTLLTNRELDTLTFNADFKLVNISLQSLPFAALHCHATES
uniref:Uncharacterized protein n=1 Tax=Anguilla anguilla TaxID=7936 RepID=A0A0E9Q2S9_ANGAN